MDQATSYVIIGNGIAGITAAETLRSADASCRITVVSEAPYPVYYRPALKDFLSGHLPEEKLWARHSTFYREQRIRFVLGRVTQIAPARHTIRLHDYTELHYDKLLIASGAYARTLDCPGSDLSGVLTLRTIADYQQTRQYLHSHRQIVVYGSGPLAIETVETLQQQGHTVTHLLRYQTLWSEVLDQTASDIVLQEEQQAGVAVHINSAINAITGQQGHVSEVHTVNGDTYPCDLLLLAIGIEANLSFLQGSGIIYQQGIRVDQSMQTSVPDVYAAGDAIETQTHTGHSRLLGQWYPAIQQARIAAQSMLVQSSSTFQPQHFYNATFLYGLDFVALGHTRIPTTLRAQQEYQEFIAPPQPHSYRKVILHNGIPVGALLLGNRTQGPAFKRAIEQRISLKPILHTLFAEDFDLATWLDRQKVFIPTNLQGAFNKQATGLLSAFKVQQEMQLTSSVKQVTAGLPTTQTHKERTPFTQAQINFEIDMCIGCDRCMVACPVPESSLIHISELNAATLNKPESEKLTRFVQDCILCGSCVPVCPVDNHRDQLLLSLKQRLGAAWDGAVSMAAVMQALPQGWQPVHLLQRLREHKVFSNHMQVPDNYLLHLFLASTLHSYTPHTRVIQEGEYGRDLYFILEGSLLLSAQDAQQQAVPFAVLNRGEYVGEYGMLTGQPHNVTAHVQHTALILQVPEQAMQRLMDLAPNVRRFFEQLNNARSLHSILKRMHLFQGLAEHEIQSLAKQAQVRGYERNEDLFTVDQQTGKRPARETLHIILEGFVKVARQSTTGDEYILAYRQGGDYFAGGLDLLGGGRAVTATTITRTRIAEISGHAMQALFRRYPEVTQRFKTRLQQYVESTSALQTNEVQPYLREYAASTRPLLNPDTQTELQALVKHGVVEGTEVLVIDLNTCIHCGECEEACERRHGHSRMNRKGIVIGNMSIATTCRQCQDPVCMLCSRSGIARKPTGEVFITESCIGCGICAERCPYGAISIVDATPAEEVSQASWQRFSQLFSRKKPEPAYDPIADIRKKIAIKCDLCAGYKDQACVQACPTGAAFRVHPTKFFGSTEDILK